MSNDLDTPTAEKRKKSRVRIVGTLVVLALLVIVGLLAKTQIERIKLNNKVESYLREAQSFIDGRKFNRAEESLGYAEELRPGLRDIRLMKTSLGEAKVIYFYEKELTSALQKKDWDEVQSAVIQLKAKSPDHPQIEVAKEQIEKGRFRDKLNALMKELALAQKQEKLPQVITASQNLLKHDPENANAARWENINQMAKEELLVSEKKARQFYEQALLIDKGMYSPELYSLASKARKLSEKPLYQSFFDKVSQYPRVIRYPNEYSNLQDAINEARAIDTVQVSQGTFHAPIRIDKEVTLVGEEGQSVIIHSAGSSSPVVYVSKSGKLNVKNLMMRHTDTSEEKEAYSVLVVEGEAQVNACAVYQSAAHGVHALNGGSVIMDSCRVEGNRWDGAAASGEGSLVVLKRSVVARNRQNGVGAWDGGSVELFDSFSEGNTMSGMSSFKLGNLKVVGSTVRSNKHAGLYVGPEGTAQLKRSELSKNRLAGGYGNQSGTVTLEGVKVVLNSEAGIVLTKGTTWQGLDAVEFIDNAGKDVWADAEFRIAEILEEKVSDTTTEGTASEDAGAEAVDKIEEVVKDAADAIKEAAEEAQDVVTEAADVSKPVEGTDATTTPSPVDSQE